MRFITTFVLAILVLALAGAAFVASGRYEIGADEPHWAITARAIDLLRNRSIEIHARGIAVPDLQDPKRLAEGAEHYAAMCTGCHLAPGMQDSELRRGLYPTPPNLAQQPIADAAQAFWTIKHGVKLSAMPAWGTSHDDDAIWALVAFVKQLPHMTPQQYQQATGGGAEHEHHHHHGDANADGDAGDEHHDHVHDDADHTHDAAPAAQTSHVDVEQRQTDVRARGPQVMPFSLDATQHVFEKTDSGGTQRVLAREHHPEQVASIREHLRGIAAAFAARDFSGPTHIHGAGMPGLAQLKAAPYDALAVTYREIDGGGELTYRAQTPVLQDAVHRWFDAQLADHGADATDHMNRVHGS
jgi:mono/diheme cytochrome c family protein